MLSFTASGMALLSLLLVMDLMLWFHAKIVANFMVQYCIFNLRPIFALF